MNRLHATLAVALVLFGNTAATNAAGDVAATTSTAPATEPLEELDTVLVIGEQPGPGLWKVSKGDNVMWVLASYGPLPKDMRWGSARVEQRIRESQAVLYPGEIGIRPDVGLLKAITLIPSAIKAAKIPKDQTLADVIPADSHARWRELRDRYVPKDDDIERLRPALALSQLRSAALRRAGLAGGVDVESVVNAAAKKHKVRVTRLKSLQRTVRWEDPRATLKGASKLALPDVDCFVRGLDRVEPEVVRARRLANAWSTGDVATLRGLVRVRAVAENAREDCIYTLMAAMGENQTAAAAGAKKLLDDIIWHLEQSVVQRERDWIVAAQAALDKNRSTFAVLPLTDVLRPNAYLQRLRALGYEVEEPI